MSTDSGSEETFEQRIEAMYDRYRRQHLEDELEELADLMEETLLQQALAEAFFGESIEIEDDVKQAVEETIDELDSGNYDVVEEEIDALSEEIQAAETHVTNRIQQLRIDLQDTIRAMRRLNDRVERVDGARVAALEGLLDDWNWKPEVYTEANETFEARRSAAVEYGEVMAHNFSSLKEDLFEVYDGTELRPLVDSLLDEDTLRLGELTDEERTQLSNSDLAEYIELKLS